MLDDTMRDYVCLSFIDLAEGVFEPIEQREGQI